MDNKDNTNNSENTVILVFEDDETGETFTTLEITEDLYNKLQNAADKENTSIQELIVEYIDDYTKKQAEGKKPAS